MAVLPVRFFTQTAETNAAAALAAATPTATAATTAAATTQTPVTTFAAVPGQVLGALGPLAFDTTLTNIGTGINTSGGGLSSIVFILLLLNSLGLRQITSQPAAQQLLITQLLFSATNTSDSTGLGAIGTADLTTALAQQATSNTLLTQLTNVSTQPNPILFSAGALAQAFQIGNGIGEPA
jgi:hypothetical protein